MNSATHPQGCISAVCVARSECEGRRGFHGSPVEREGGDNAPQTDLPPIHVPVKENAHSTWVSPLVSRVPPCCFKQCVLPSDRRRVSPTAGAQRSHILRRKQQLLCAAPVTVRCSGSTQGKPALFNFTYIYMSVLIFLLHGTCFQEFREKRIVQSAERAGSPVTQRAGQV